MRSGLEVKKNNARLFTASESINVVLHEINAFLLSTNDKRLRVSDPSGKPGVDKNFFGRTRSATRSKLRIRFRATRAEILCLRGRSESHRSIVSRSCDAC